ncbi:MAG: glycosyltransferase family 4 protein [Acidobacteriota bacterium]|nr:glycosyltransferase family 4 protein [Acidobacteriota bacterium]
MTGLKVLITNFMFATRSGTEVYVRDLALGLLERGHTPIIYSPELGELARELRLATVPVVDDLSAVAAPPDVIHGHHHIETMTALLHFPGVPAVYVCHDWYSHLDCPPRFPRLLRYVAIDQTCYDKLVFEYAVPEERVKLLLNSVNLGRFRPRPPLPPRPRRALVYNSYTIEDQYLEALRAACAGAGIRLDVVGQKMGTATSAPEKVLAEYDLVFAKGRSALEALAVGAAVVVQCTRSLGPMVTSGELERLLPLNFGIRAMRHPATPEALARQLSEEIARYDPADAAEVSRRVRRLSGSDQTVDELVALYREVIAEHRDAPRASAEAESRAAADFIRWLGTHSQDRLSELNNSAAIRLKQRLVAVPFIGRVAHSLARRLAGPAPQ